MPVPPEVEVLNELLAAEQSAVCHRLLEATVFVSQLSMSEAQFVSRLAAECSQHTAWLADRVLQLGASPSMRRADVRTADLHFMDLHRAWPRLIENHRQLLDGCTLAAGQLASAAQSARLVGRIQARHVKQLEDLQHATAGPSTPARSAR